MGTTRVYRMVILLFVLSIVSVLRCSAQDDFPKYKLKELEKAAQGGDS